MPARSAKDRGTGSRQECRAAIRKCRLLLVSIGPLGAFVNMVMPSSRLCLAQLHDRALTSRPEATLAALAAIVTFLFELFTFYRLLAR